MTPLGGWISDHVVVRYGRKVGFRIVPMQVEFWRDGAFRLHDRIRFTRPGPESGWTTERLFP